MILRVKITVGAFVLLALIVRAKEAPAQTVPSGQGCIACHTKVTPRVVKEYMAGAHWRRSRISCETCHGHDHDRIVKSGGIVADELCAKCHAPVYREHTEGGHSYGPDEFIQGTNWERNISSPHYSQFPPDVRRLSCDPCHSIAGATFPRYWDESQARFTDTSTLKNRGGCGKCHTPHGFSLEEARRPEACTSCHTGPEDSSAEAYFASSHGGLYAATGQGWDWRSSLKTARYRAPTCAYCHMRIVGEKGVGVTHNMSRKINWGMGLEAPTPADRVSQGKRKEMLGTCAECHSLRFAQEYLESADKARMTAGLLVKEGREIVEGLYKDRILDIGLRTLSPGLSGTPHTFTASKAVGLNWTMGLFYDTSRVERAFHDLAVFHTLTAVKGSYHNSPAHAWWKGFLPAYEDLVEMRREDHSLRSAAKVRRYALIGIGLGGVAVILFLFAPRQKRRRPGIEL